MEQKNSLTINLTSKQIKDVNSFCELNDLQVEKFINDCFISGFNIERYGILDNSSEKIIEKEVIVEVPVEIIKEIPKEVEIIKYVDKEVIKEVIIEVPVEKIVYVHEKTEEPNKYKTKLEQIQKTVLNLQQTIIQKDNEISNLTKTLREIEEISGPIKVQFMRTSNLDDNLYKK